MKNNLLALLILCSAVNVRAQITLENSYPAFTSDNKRINLFIIHFSGAGYKYGTTTPTAPNSSVINIYNLNHSLYKSITTPASIPNTQGVNGALLIWNISDSLFNTNTSDIEYCVYWWDSTDWFEHFRIFDEVGNMLVSIDSSFCQPAFTTNGWKLQCGSSGSIPGNFNLIFSVPGALPCDECVNHVLTIAPNPAGSNNYIFNPYPNPANSSVIIQYQLPSGTNQGQIIFYDMQSKEVKRFIVDRTFDTLSLSAADMPAGTYFYVLQTARGNIGSKKMIVIK